MDLKQCTDKLGKYVMLCDNSAQLQEEIYKIFGIFNISRKSVSL